MEWKAVFDDMGVQFTLFVIPDVTGDDFKLTVEDLDSLHNSGHEVASHTYSHAVLTTDEAFLISYTGQALSCSLTITDDSLFLNSSDNSEDRSYCLTDSSVLYFMYLADSLHWPGHVSCTLRTYPIEHGAFRSKHLVITDPVDIAQTPYLARSEKGCDLDSLVWELRRSEEWLDSVITDPEYSCRTLAYPTHLHDIREMTVVRDSSSYVAARDGGKWGERPNGCNPCKTRWDSVTLYEVPIAEIIRNIVGDSSSFTEQETRQAIQDCIAEWKADNLWANIYSHRTFGPDGCDSTHMRWILEELQADGDVWVAPFGEVADYVRETHWSPDGFTWIPIPDSLECGDANGDWTVTSGDGYYILNYYGSGSQPDSCWAANVNGDDVLTPGDGYYILNYFGSGPVFNCQPCEF
jgi:hypothetical protein